jgi:hypothetical protein
VNAEISDHQQAIARRKTEELLIDVATTLNENIVQSGKLLSNIVGANGMLTRNRVGVAGAFKQVVK